MDHPSVFHKFVPDHITDGAEINFGVLQQFVDDEEPLELKMEQ